MKFNINFFFCLLLTKHIIEVAPIQNRKVFSCNCMLLQSCDFFNAFIDFSSNKSHITAVIQNAVCSADGFNVFVCCPDKVQSKPNTKERHNMGYVDLLTRLNCPPSFGIEYKYDEYVRNKVSKKYDHHGSDNVFNAVNNKHHEYSSSVFCDNFGNCDNESPLDHQQYYHNHDIHAPFFPHTAMPHSKTYNSCGILPSVLQSSVEVHPWIIRLAYLNTTSGTIRYRCMGTVITDEHILTAAHCVHQLVRDLRIIFARIGDDKNFEDYQILETIVHPNYNEPLFNNDIAIIKVAIKPEKKVPLMQICLPSNNKNTLSGDSGIVAGWSGNESSTIRYIALHIMNNTECAIRYAKYSENFETGIVITPTEFCAEAKFMNDVCEGDSGGPFMERSKSEQYTLLGIVSFGPSSNCGQSNLPGVYMRVSAYVDWIKSKIL